MEILVLNGPNLNLLGRRETQTYGTQTFESFFQELEKEFHGHRLIYRQSNGEGSLIDYLHEFGLKADGVVLNPGGYSHTSVALADAVLALDCPVVEVHISNVFKREKFRHRSYISPVAAGVIVGLGLEGYRHALRYLIERVK